MTAATVTSPSYDVIRLQRRVVDMLEDLHPDLADHEPTWAAALDGAARMAAAAANPAYHPSCLADVHEALVHLYGAVCEESSFHQDPKSWLDTHRYPRTDEVADAKARDLESDVEHWSQRLVEAVR